MIIAALLDVVYLIISVLTLPIDIPSMPDGVRTVILTAVEHLQFGLGLLSNWTDLAYLLTLFGLILAVDVGVLLYKAVMWFLRKIPMLGIK